MPLYLVDLLMDNAWMVDAAASERMRMIVWMTAQVNSKKQLKPEDLMTFTWEHEPDERDETPMTTERWERLQEQARKMRDKMIKKDG